MRGVGCGVVALNFEGEQSSKKKLSAGFQQASGLKIDQCGSVRNGKKMREEV
jgi:hypothetical protein